MKISSLFWGLVLATSTAVGCGSGSSESRASDADVGSTADVGHDAQADAQPDVTSEPTRVRVATFNASLFRGAAGELRDDLEGGGDLQARRVAQVLQTVRPDIVLINEFDWDAEGVSAQIFAESYLGVSQDGGEPLDYAYRLVPATNTGLHSGVDLNNSGAAVSEPGTQAYGDDAFGFGVFPGQYGMAVFSRYSMATEDVRSFQKLLWRDMPDHLLPEDWYAPETVEVLRLSSKNHVDIPVWVGGERLHLLVSHPTPPSFDGEEDRNGRRNHDEIRFWVDYVTGGAVADYIRDDQGGAGGLAATERFVILGDLNSDPNDGDSQKKALKDLLTHPRVKDTLPSSHGAPEAADRDGQANTNHVGQASLDTADFSDGRVGNLRVDYALPSSNLEVVGSGVFWQATNEADEELSDVSDHHLVWVDVLVGR